MGVRGASGSTFSGDGDGRRALWVEVSTGEGEVLERLEIAVTDDPFYPLGRGPARAALLAEIEAAAKTLQARRA